MGSTAYLAAAIVGLTVVTIATRSSFFMLPARIELPANVERALRYAPACALTAIVVQGVLARDHQPYVSVHNYQMWALIAAGLVFAKTRNMIAMMVVGMAVFTVLRLSF
ncbi:MAG TPA: AzlD domain-containing protein [Ilumatobacteraceae bacterium]|nr:AzlD domain-containing protein [Ilumatobacteraceae bacterium]HRB04637.1 AzlD domain-containing protein [Ilumatobacteraceae bacterium]